MAELRGFRFSCHRCEAWLTLRTSEFTSLSCSFISWKNGDHLLAPFSDGTEEMLESTAQWCALEAVPLVDSCFFFFLADFYVILAMGLKTWIYLRYLLNLLGLHTLHLWEE